MSLTLWKIFLKQSWKGWGNLTLKLDWYESETKKCNFSSIIEMGGVIWYWCLSDTSLESRNTTYQAKLKWTGKYDIEPFTDMSLKYEWPFLKQNWNGWGYLTLKLGRYGFERNIIFQAKLTGRGNLTLKLDRYEHEIKKNLFLFFSRKLKRVGLSGNKTLTAMSMK